MRRELIAIIVLVVILIVTGLAIGTGDQYQSHLVGETGPHDPSVFNDRASGTRGCFEWLGRLGYKTIVSRSSWNELGSSPESALICIDPAFVDSSIPLLGSDADSSDDEPSYVLSAQDAGYLTDWIKRGHTVILCTAAMTDSGGPGAGSSTTFGNALGFGTTEAPAKGFDADFAPAFPVRDVAGITSVDLDSSVRIRRKPSAAITLFGDRFGSAVVLLPVGSGRLVVISDPDFLSNAGLPKADNAAFIANVIRHYVPAGAVIAFDEYHHGDIDQAGGNAFWHALGQPLQLILFQLLLAGLVVLFVVSPRFGPARSLEDGRSRSSNEYLSSVAGLYRRAGAGSAAFEILYSQFLRSLCTALGISPDTRMDVVARIAAKRSDLSEPALLGFFSRCEQVLRQGRVNEHDLLALVHEMETIRKDLRIA